LPILLNGCETWSLTLRKEHRLEVFENSVLRLIFGPKREKKVGSLRILHNDELHGLYSSPDIVRVIKSRRMRCVGLVSCMKEWRGVHRVLVGRSKGRKPLERSRHRWEDNIMIGINGANWIRLAQDEVWWRLL
jgi:hypothetical protein